MGKKRYITFITIASVVFILLLQGVWVVQVYKLIQKQLLFQTNELLKLSINRELIIRERLVVNSLTNEIIGTSLNSYDEGMVGSTEILLQEFFAKKGYPVVLNVMDTIFHSEINKHKIRGDFIINRINSQTGEVLETTASLKSGELQGAIASEIIPVRMDGSEGIQVLLVSPYRTVFRRMMFILVLSLLLLVFVSWAVFFLLRRFITEKELREFQTDFSHTLIHDMATPLQTIFQINSLLIHDKYVLDPVKRNKGIAVSQQQVVSLQALVDRVLIVARAEQSQLVPVLEVMNINEMIHELIDKFLLQGKKEIIFTTNLASENIYVSADRILLTNAVSNLIDNCVKYSGQTVYIIIECILKENGLYISIKDDGYGISDKDQRIIFAKFERGPAVNRQEVRGFGLGLTYVKSVAEAHQGTVNLYSKQGEGTVFELFIPFK